MITGILWKLECHLRFRTSYYLQKQSIKDRCFFQVTCVPLMILPSSIMGRTSLKVRQKQSYLVMKDKPLLYREVKSIKLELF